LQEKVSFPFVLRGRENDFKRYSGFPREWEHRVSSIDLSYVEIEPEVLFDSLDLASPLESLKLTSVKFLSANTAGRRVVLPNLKEFSLDLLENLSESSVIKITTEVLHQLLFFDRSYTKGGGSLFGNDAKIDLTLSFYRILHLNEEELFVNRIPSCSEVVERSYDNPDFNLEKLAISGCKFDFNHIQNPAALISLNFYKVDISNLQLDRLVSLESLILRSDGTNPVVIDLGKLPQNLHHLCLFGATDVGMTRVKHTPSSGGISLQDTTFLDSNLEYVKIFCCISCQLSQPFVDKIPTIFPNLLYFYFQSNANVEGFTEFVGIKLVPGAGSYLFHRTNTTFTNTFRLVKLASDVVKQSIQFQCTEGSQFWTSPQELLLRERLKSFEVKALNSNRFELVGEQRSSEERDRLTKIPVRLQPRLTSISLENVEVSPMVLADSVANCGNLKVLSLSNISLEKGSTGNRQLQRKSITYELRSLKGFTSLKYVREVVNGVLTSFSIPFQSVGKFKKETSNTLHRLFTDVGSVQLKNNSAFVYTYNVTLAEGFAAVEYILQVIATLPENHELKIMSPPLFELYKLSYVGRKLLPPDWKFRGLSTFQKSLFRVGNIAREFPPLDWLVNNVERFGYNPHAIGKRVMGLGHQFSASSPGEIAIVSKSLPQIIAANLVDDDYAVYEK